MRATLVPGLGMIAFAGVAAACGSDPASPAAADAGARPVIDVGPPSLPEGGAVPSDGLDAGHTGDAADHAGPSRFATRVVSFAPGGCAGFGASAMPGVVLGPPVGGGTTQGSLDVVALGRGGEIVLSVEPNAIVDGPGPDFVVFENALNMGGDPDNVFAEPGEVSVSDDLSQWYTYPCTATKPPYGACAGWHPTLSSPGNGVSPIDPRVAGGDPFDLAQFAVPRARFVRIRDRTQQACPDGGSGFGTHGFDLDAIAVVNGEVP